MFEKYGDDLWLIDANKWHVKYSVKINNVIRGEGENESVIYRDYYRCWIKAYFVSKVWLMWNNLHIQMKSIAGVPTTFY